MNINVPREPETAEELVAHLRELRAKREAQKKPIAFLVQGLFV